MTNMITKAAMEFKKDSILENYSVSICKQYVIDTFTSPLRIFPYFMFPDTNNFYLKMLYTNTRKYLFLMSKTVCEISGGHQSGSQP
jgi:hypothetical protein